MCLSLTGCGPLHGRTIGIQATVAASAETMHPRAPGPTPSPVPSRAPCASIAPGLSCTMQKRIAMVEKYLAAEPGHIAVVLHDRSSDATWRNADGDSDFPAASTVKLAMVVDLMLRNRDGSIQLDSGDWGLMDDILSTSSDTAADQLWFAFEDSSFLGRIQAFGMSGTSFSASPAYWGFMYCSAQDLDNLMNFILNDLPSSDRNFITSRMRQVAPIQQWGVWGAGAAKVPGDKDGWEDDSGVWIVNTVGFALRGAPYTLAIMYDLDGEADFHTGSDVLDQVSSLLFRGRFGPAPTVEATPLRIWPWEDLGPRNGRAPYARVP